MPMVVTDSLGLIGDCMMPVSMLLIGAEIASMNVKEIFDNYLEDNSKELRLHVLLQEKSI